MSSPFFRLLVLPVLFSAVAHADLDDWRVSQLPVASAGDNNWYFFPDIAKTPRVLVKATGTGNNVNRRLLTGGPPVWTAEPATATPSLNKQGISVPFLNGMFLIAAHNNALRMTFLNASGAATASELIDSTVPVTSTGLSAALDPDGNLHVIYIGRSGTSTETIRYARRTTSGSWIKTNLDLSTTTSPFIRNTVILPSSPTSATVYASMKTGTVVSLLRLSISITGTLPRFSNPANLGNNIAEPIAGNRLGGADRVYYFLSNGQQSAWNMRQVNDPDPIQTIGLALPTSIICKPGPDNKQRVVWLDGLGKKIHYLKPSTDPQKVFDVLHPVTGTTGSAEVRGLHFDPSDTPYLLYRNNSSQGFIAYPDENFDSDGNGRADLLDFAFNSTKAGIDVLPPGPAAPGLPLSENKFKFRIPTIGSAFVNGTGGIQSTKNLIYSVQTSTNAINWTTLGSGSPLFFVEHSSTGTFPDQVKTFTVMYNETIPAAPSRRFFRVKVTRPAVAY
ncbi:hypothetical protein OKA04_06235 [Luteolibacter flavescens]|uniref:Uncharacterized protein n=1 Tax=Luteolibacter flavescens TaxID=1859460 RepID=A0ABT3FL63_9BACT|nr:hypothetical protein [Luteolibacter flavescens]MCW1884322.1 hypothetical protein [Luteolibacter flavescens]